MWELNKIDDLEAMHTGKEDEICSNIPNKSRT